MKYLCRGIQFLKKPGSSTLCLNGEKGVFNPTIIVLCIYISRYTKRFTLLPPANRK